MSRVPLLFAVPVAISLLVGCARRPSGEYDPNEDADLQLPWSPEAVAPEGAVADSDGDGVSDEEEARLGLDPELSDSDGDGYEDGEEVAANSDALDPSHFPYIGGWAIDACRTELIPTGNAAGSVTDDFSLLDQNGQQVHLHDFCGREVLLVTSAMWCGPCQDEAPELQHWYETYEAQGFMVITLLGENEGNVAPSQADLMAWASTYGLSHPVLADPGWAVSNRWPGNYIPTMHLIGAGATVIGGNSYFGESDIQANLP